MKNRFWFYYFSGLIAIILVAAVFTSWWLFVRPSSVRSECQKITNSIATDAKTSAIKNIDDSTQKIKVSTPELVAEYNAKIQAQKDAAAQKAATHQQLVKNYCDMMFSLYSFQQDCISQNAYGNTFLQEKPTGGAFFSDDTVSKNFVDSQAEIDSAKNDAVGNVDSLLNPGKEEAYNFCLSAHGVKH